MKIRFARQGYGMFEDTEEIICEFDVYKEPTAEECKAITEYIDKVMEEWDEEHDSDFADFDYFSICKEAVNKYIRIKPNALVKTFYL